MPLYARIKTIVAGLPGIVLRVDCREVILPGKDVRIRCVRISSQQGRRLVICEKGLVGELFKSEDSLKAEIERRIKRAHDDLTKPQREPIAAQS